MSKRSVLLFLAAIASLVNGSIALAADNNASTDRGAVMEAFVGFVNWLEATVYSTVPIFGTDVEVIVLWMAAPMVLLTLYFGFINLKSFKTAFHVLRGDYQDDKSPGEVTQFQALTTALSGTVGLGNIAGVAVAIAIGGPGATFWMIMIGLFAMSLKFAECTLGVKYRVHHADGTVSGGPMYYLKAGLAKKGWHKSGMILAWSYALVAVIALIPQFPTVNQAYSQFSGTLGFSGTQAELAYGIVFGLLTAVVIIGGIRSIASVTSRLVPFMTITYVAAALTVILGHFTVIDDAFILIFKSAFNPESVGGGIIGSFVAGMRRAVYSTEAGLGTATMAHAAAKTDEPVSEGMVALMEPFIDTVVICTMTALVIVITGAYQFTGANGQLLGDIQMTSAAFASVFSWFPYVLVLAVQLFAFSTVISWGYYAGKVWNFVFGEGEKRTRLFQVIFCLAIVPAPLLTILEVYAFVDSMYFVMAIPNIIGIYILAPELKADIADYLRRLKSGAIKSNRASASTSSTQGQEI